MSGSLSAWSTSRSAWTSNPVTRALRLIGEGALDDGDVDALAARLGVTSRQADVNTR